MLRTVAAVAFSTLMVRSSAETWTRLTEHASFPGAYNFPVVVVNNRFWALHPEGNWSSTDGREWTKSPLPQSGLREGYLDHVVLNGALYQLGEITGNYLKFTLSTRIRRTRDFVKWETVADSSNLPRRFFYATTVYRGAIWMFGGFDGANYYNDVWRSTDAVHWTRVTEHAQWDPRANQQVIVWRDKFWLMGGGKIDGGAKGDVWSSPDGITWTRATAQMAADVPFGYTPVVYDDRLWLVGANRSGTFSSEMLVSSDGAHWTAVRAPWSPRGGVAVWVANGLLYMTGGKYSTGSPPNIQFIYRNDVWTMK